MRRTPDCLVELIQDAVKNGGHTRRKRIRRAGQPDLILRAIGNPVDRSLIQRLLDHRPVNLLMRDEIAALQIVITIVDFERFGHQHQQIALPSADPCRSTERPARHGANPLYGKVEFAPSFGEETAVPETAYPAAGKDDLVELRIELRGHGVAYAVMPPICHP